MRNTNRITLWPAFVIVVAFLLMAAYRSGQMHPRTSASVAAPPGQITVTFELSPDASFTNSVFVVETNLPAKAIEGHGYMKLVPILSPAVGLTNVVVCGYPFDEPPRPTPAQRKTPIITNPIYHR